MAQCVLKENSQVIPWRTVIPLTQNRYKSESEVITWDDFDGNIKLLLGDSVKITLNEFGKEVPEDIDTIDLATEPDEIKETVTFSEDVTQMMTMHQNNQYMMY